MHVDAWLRHGSNHVLDFFYDFTGIYMNLLHPLEVGYHVHPSSAPGPPDFWDVGYQSTPETPFLADFRPPLKARKAKNRYPTFIGTFRGPELLLTVHWKTQQRWPLCVENVEDYEEGESRKESKKLGKESLVKDG